MLHDYNYPSLEDEGWIHKNNLPDFDDTKDFLKGIVESLYETGDMEQLKHCVGELCFQYDVKIEEEEKKEENLMDWYIGYQRQVIDKCQKSLNEEK